MNKATAIRLIRIDHWKKGKPLRLIERERNLANGCLSMWAKRLGLKVMSKKQAGIAASPYRKRFIGQLNPRWGKTKETDRWCRWASRRMKRENPSRDPRYVQKIRNTLAVRLRKDPSALEADLVEPLRRASFEHQAVISGFIADFAHRGARVILEIDGRGHASRLDVDFARDNRLIEEGWIVTRVRRDHRRTFSPSALWIILKELIPDAKFPSPDPATPMKKYGMLVRSKKNPAGIKVYAKDLSPIRNLRDNRIDAP